ncbi:MAG: hypothetical protein D6744_17510 [Planctomycetota bacterium]|nr:MAG: hypothetical protein D6744_17510 [Planctomycetota bacterium]
MVGTRESARNRRALAGAVVSAVVITLSGCTRESLRVAIDTQRRADQVQQSIFDQQHESLRILLYRDLLARLAQAGPAPNERQRVVLSDAWNERDRIEFWRVQHERARALRLAGVDAKLFADQSIVDLLYKALTTKFERGKQGLAAHAGASLETPAKTPASQSP